MIYQPLLDAFLQVFERTSVQQLYFAASLFVIALVALSPAFSSLVWPIQMILENLGLNYAFRWFGDATSKIDSGSEKLSKPIRTRAEQLAARNAGAQDECESSPVCDKRQYAKPLINH
jgi:hypothetical protein